MTARPFLDYSCRRSGSPISGTRIALPSPHQNVVSLEESSVFAKSHKTPAGAGSSNNDSSRRRRKSRDGTTTVATRLEASNTATAMPTTFDGIRTSKPTSAVSLQPLLRDDRAEDERLRNLSLSQNEATMRCLFNEADTEVVGFLDGVATMKVLRLMGFKMSEAELWEMLREIDVNEAPRPTRNVLELSRLLHFDFDIIDLQGVVGGLNNNDETSVSQLEKKLSTRRVLFEDFMKLVQLWENSAQFQLFEERDAETAHHVREATRTKMVATDGMWMCCWQVVMLATSTYLLMVAVAIFTNQEKEVAQYFALYTPVDALVTVVLLVDLILKFLCCRVRVEERTSVVLDDHWAVAKDYVSSWWFVIDVVTLLPWRFTCFVGGSTQYLLQVVNSTAQLPPSSKDLIYLVDADQSGCVGCRTLADYETHIQIATFLMLLRALKFVEHYRYFDETGLTPITRWYVFQQYVMGYILVQLARFCVAVHVLSVIYMSIDRMSHEQFGEVGIPSRYAEAIYLTLYCMATVGYGDIVPKSDMQRIYAMFLCMTGWLFSAYVVGSLIGFAQASAIDADRQSKLLELSTLLDYFDVPEALALEILSFENYVLQNSISKSFEYVVSDLPDDMKRNLELWSRIKVVNSNPLFCDLHRSAKLLICRALVEVTFCPEDYVFSIGEVGVEMYFITYGFIDILDHDSVCECTKRAGDYVGELGAFQLTPCIRANDAKCLSYCETFVLRQENLTQVRKQYPRVQRAIDEYLTGAAENEQTKLEFALSVRGGGVVGSDAMSISSQQREEALPLRTLASVPNGVDDDRRFSTWTITERSATLLCTPASQSGGGRRSPSAALGVVHRPCGSQQSISDMDLNSDTEVDGDVLASLVTGIDMVGEDPTASSGDNSHGNRRKVRSGVNRHASSGSRGQQERSHRAVVLESDATTPCLQLPSVPTTAASPPSQTLSMDSVARLQQESPNHHPMREENINANNDDENSSSERSLSKPLTAAAVKDLDIPTLIALATALLADAEDTQRLLDEVELQGAR